MTGTATCACGACSVSVDGDVHLNGICHCDNCKRRTGSSYGWSLYVDTASITSISGPFQCFRAVDDPVQGRFFCRQCGSTLYWKTGHFPNWTGLAGGTFPPGVAPAPVGSYHGHTKLDWTAIPKDCVDAAL